MPKGCIKYKDVYAAPGSALHTALKENRLQDAARIFAETKEREKSYAPDSCQKG